MARWKSQLGGCAQRQGILGIEARLRRTPGRRGTLSAVGQGAVRLPPVEPKTDGFEIVDAPELKSVFILNMGGPHSWRVIYTDGRMHPKPEDLRPTSLGHSIGRWEGDTLIVDTVGFNEKIWIMGSYPTTDQLHLTERFTRPTLGSLEYEVTVDDPGAYTGSWSARGVINESGAAGFVANGEMFEYICQDDR